MTPPSLPPVLTPETARDTNLDAVRGLAILGLIFVNIASFASVDPYWDWLGRPKEGPTATRAADFLIDWLVAGKCVTLLCFLLGVGLALQRKRALAAGESFGGLAARRLGVLLALGGLHIVFLWHGDILFTYALLGFGLLALHRFPPIALRWIAGAGMTFTVLLLGGCSLLTGDETDAELLAKWETFLRGMETIHQQGPFHKTALVRIGEAVVMQAAMLLITPFSLGLVLLGYDAVQSGWFPVQGRRWPTGLVGTLGAGGVILSGVCAWITVHWPASSLAVPAALVLGMPAAAMLGAVYLQALLNLREGLIQRVLARVGRTALSNYLLQSLCAAIVFHHWGFGQYGRLSHDRVLLIALGIVAVQLAWPVWWLRLFRFGPMEFLWRKLSYGPSRVSLRR